MRNKIINDKCYNYYYNKKKTVKIGETITKDEKYTSEPLRNRNLQWTLSLSNSSPSLCLNKHRTMKAQWGSGEKALSSPSTRH
jgi:hypothetical protein